MELEHLIPSPLETKKLIYRLIISEDPFCDEFGEIREDWVIKERSRL
jgi:hypothetical protein